MNVSQVTASTTAMTAATRNLQAIQETQMAIMKVLAESQQQMAAMLQAAGIGQNIDAHA